MKKFHQTNCVVGTYSDNSQESRAARENLVKRLDAYEIAFEKYFEDHPKHATEALAHHNGLYDAGLTEAGLCTARAWAGKKPSMKPGVFVRIADYNI